MRKVKQTLLSAFVMSCAFSQAQTKAKYQIPVVVHVASSTADFFYTEADIRTGLENLNSMMRNGRQVNHVNTNHANKQGMLDVELVLASINPQGIATTGVLFHPNQALSNGNGWASAQTLRRNFNWNVSNYLNIYLTENLGGTTGFGSYPETPLQPYDGINVLNGIWPVTNVVSYPGFNTGGYEGVAAHELGHYLNLKHLQGDPVANATCGSASMHDEVIDTPRVDNPLQQSIDNNTETMASCFAGENGMLDNFMSYSRRQRIFTKGQTDRMENALDGPRQNLWSLTNLYNTGVVSPSPLNAECRIQRVKILETTNNTAAINYVAATTPAANYTAHNFGNAATPLATNQKYKLLVSVNDFQPGGVNNDTYLSLWADWNNDKVFSPNEVIIGKKALTSKVGEIEFTVPDTVFRGRDIMLRVAALKIANHTAFASPIIDQDFEFDTINASVVDFKVNIPTAVVNMNACTTVSRNTGNSGDASYEIAEIIKKVKITANNEADNAENVYDNKTSIKAYKNTKTKAFKVYRNKNNTMAVDLANVFSTNNQFSRVKAWIDWNNDGNFSNDNAVYVSGAAIVTANTEPAFAANNTTLTRGAVVGSKRHNLIINNIPQTAVTGNHYPMRVRSFRANDANPAVGDFPNYDSNATTEENYGQVFDFLVKVENGHCTPTLNSSKTADQLTSIQVDADAAYVFPAVAATDDKAKLILKKDKALSLNIVHKADQTAPLDNYAQVWIDWNKDGVFNRDASESYLSDFSNDAKSSTINFKVPASAVIGEKYTMRIFGQSANALPAIEAADPCSTANLAGQYKDILVEVKENYCISNSAIYDDTLSLIKGRIQNVSISNTRVAKDSYAAYNDYSASVFDLQRNNNAVSIQLANSTADKNYASVWIDWNNNGLFEDNEIINTNKTNANNDALSLNINVDAARPHGSSYRMRVRSKYSDNAVANSLACDTNNNGMENSGQTNDYVVRINAPMSLATQEITNAKAWQIAPNPSKGDVYIHTSIETQMGVYNLLGQQVAVFALKPGENFINLGHLPKATYIFKSIDSQQAADKIILE
jgi:Pregnancy-associated plasma protein-A/GEVED domain